MVWALAFGFLDKIVKLFIYTKERLFFSIAQWGETWIVCFEVKHDVIACSQWPGRVLMSINRS